MEWYIQNFCATSGSKQGGIISPILFCIYINVLLSRLKDSGVDCYLGQWFVEASAYADDIVLLTPAAHEMRKTLTLRSDFANEYCVQFNIKKSTYIRLGVSKTSSLLAVTSRNRI
jgi:Reverse transcriptase (RNA-dependent DNA polymerase)